jgi:tRNA(Arg) A34 adenosine deaminase TadA
MEYLLASQFSLTLPDWLQDQLPSMAGVYATDVERMELAIALAHQNIKAQTGGPFGAIIVEQLSGRLVAVGVNRVVPSGFSIAHGEVMAICLAQQALQTFDLGAASLPSLQLVTSAEPCWMCAGAIHWSGIRSILVGARDADVRAIGFDEGYKPVDWVATMNERGVQIQLDVCREEAIAVLNQYLASNAWIYNASQPEST